MNRYKIIQLIPDISEGGAETLVKDYCLLLDKSKYEVIVVTIFPSLEDSSNYKILKKNEIKVISLNKFRYTSYNRLLRNIWRYSIHPIKTAYALKKIIKEEKPDAIHVHLRTLEYIWRNKHNLNGIKLLYTCHNRPDFMFDHKRNYLELIAAKYLVSHRSIQLIALHEQMRKELNALFHTDNTVVIHNGVNFSRFTNVTETKEQIRNDIGIGNKPFVIGHIGSFSSQKNHTYMIAIFREVVKAEPNAHLLMIGDGPLRPIVESMLNGAGLQDHYTILSHREDIPRLMKAMDVFILPSKFEGLPVTMVEAQVSGLRCVVADNITSECYFSQNVVPISIKESPTAWVEPILNADIKGDIENDISVFDMKNVILKLGNLYTK